MKAKLNKRSGTMVLEINRSDEPLLASAATAPFRFKRILVPVDFSDCSTKALRYALPLAQQHDATISLLYVVPPPAYGFGEYAALDSSALEADLRAGGKKALEKLAADEIGQKARFDLTVRTGSPSIEIADFAGSIPADIIIISTHGRTGLKHVFLGSVAEHVVRKAPCPVLVVREHEHECLQS